MWSQLKLLSSIATLVAFAACSDSPVPVVDFSESIHDARLFGTWVALENESADVVRITVVPFDEQQMVAEFVGLESEADGIVLFREISQDIELDGIKTVEELQAVLGDRQNELGFLDDEGIRFVRYDEVSTRYPTTAVVF